MIQFWKIRGTDIIQPINLFSHPHLILQRLNQQFVIFLNKIQIQQISNMSQEQSEILQICAALNQQLQIEIENFSLRHLTKRAWYLQILQIIYPYLADKLVKIAKIQSQEVAIDRMLLLLTEQQIIEEDFLEIKGRDIILSDKDSIFYIVQLLNTLVRAELEQEDQEEEQVSNDQQAQQETEQEDEQEYQQKKPAFEEKQSHQQSVDSQVLKIGNHYQGRRPPIKQHRAVFQNLSQSKQNTQNRECHSVLGIDHQFQNEEEEQGSHQNQNDFQEFKNVFPGQSNGIPHKNQLKATNYKNEDQEENENQYLQQKLQKHKSQELFNINNKNQKKHAKVVPPTKSKTIKQLISHPSIKTKYQKAQTKQAKKLTGTVKKQILQVRKSHLQKKSNKFGQQQKLQLQEQIRRKNRQLNNYVKQHNKQKQIKKRTKIDTGHLKVKNDQNFRKLLKWKQQNMKRQKKQFEQGMQEKIQQKREAYIKKINKLIIELQKTKFIEERKEFKEKLLNQNKEATKRIVAIEKDYKDRLSLLKQKKQNKRLEERLIHTGHKEIIKQLQKELKREGQKEMMSMTMKYRRQEAEIENDLDVLTQQIMKVYKRN